MECLNLEMLLARSGTSATRRASSLVLAGEEAGPRDVLSALLDAHVRVAADVAEDGVHAGQLDARADDRVVLVGHRVEVGHAAALLQDLVVRRSEQAVGEAVPAEKEQFWILSLVSITLRSQLQGHQTASGFV